MKTIVCILAFAALIMADDTDLQKLLRDSNDQFTARMFTEVVKANPDKNVVMSAFSVLPPLGQLALASVDESHDELLRAINLPNDNVTKAVFADFNQGLRSVKGVDLKMASNIYIANGYELNEQFESVSRQYFNSEVKQVDFSKSTEAAKEINTWVEQQTNDRIKDLVSPDSLDALTRAVLVNAIYFKGSWKDKFNKDLTTDRDFHVSNDKTIKVSTMFGKRDVRYGESAELDAKLVELPYEGGQASMIFVVPNKIDGLTVLEEKLKDPKILQSAEEKMYSTEVDIFLPKFKIETTTNLKDVLINMGVKRLFTAGQAKLEKLLKSDESLYVSEAVQKAFIEVSEEGAEAAAANDIHIGLRAAFFPRAAIVVDRPFVFKLRCHTNIFIGKFTSL